MGTCCIMNCLLRDNRPPHYGYNRQIPKHVVCFHGLDLYIFYLRDLPLMLTQICCAWWSDKINEEDTCASLAFRETLLFIVYCCNLNPLNKFLQRCIYFLDLFYSACSLEVAVRHTVYVTFLKVVLEKRSEYKSMCLGNNYTQGGKKALSKQF